jgi:hypothetical protein
LVDFRLEQLRDEREEDFGEYRGPFFVIGGGEVVGEEGALERGEGLLADFAAGVETLVGEGFEDGGPVGCPCWGIVSHLVFWEICGACTFSSLEMTLLDEVWHLATELEYDAHRCTSP